MEEIHCWAGDEKNTIYAVVVRVGRVLSFWSLRSFKCKKKENIYVNLTFGIK